MKKKNYECYVCGKTASDDGSSTIMCCGQVMAEMKIEWCASPGNLEAYRFEDEDDVCDDRRAGT